MSVDAFQGLGRLKKLSLWNNNLDLRLSPYHPDVFSPLVSLEVLFLNQNMPNGSTGFGYPDRALSKLVKLRTLQIDGLENATFGPGFRNMTSLISLNVSGYQGGYCKMTSLTNKTFVNVQHLQHLNLSSCYVKGKFIEAGTFSPLGSLVSLDLTHNEDIDIVNLDKVFYGLHDTKTLRHLKMHLIVNRYSVGICLDSSYIRHFPKYLEHFDAQENNLEALDRQVISKLSPSLKSLDVSGNKFVFGTYLLDLHRMKNLTSVKINGGSFVYNLPSLYPYELSRYSLQSNCTLYGHTKVQKFRAFVLDLPPNLETIEMNEAGLKYNLSELNATHNNLKHLSLRGNYFSHLYGPFHNFDQLETLDLSFCQVKFISCHFFPSFRSLKNLSLNNNQLGDFFSERDESNETFVFSNLTSLSRLDLSYNNIRKLDPGIFKSLKSLRVLILANNSMINFTVDISLLFNLTYLDLSHNQISSLPADTRTFIDCHLKLLEIKMAQCSILCECVNLEFLLWMTGSRAFDDRFQGYLCVKEDSSIMPITDGYNSTLDELEHACTSHVTIFFFVGAGTVVMFIVILGGIIYRFRWKIRYLYYAAYLQYKRLDRKRDTGFQYDAFVSYDHSDEEFVVRTLCSELESRKLKLCIHGRDFKAGDYIASNVVKSVCSSRKTVVVLTRNMIKSYWCGYEIQMANMESIHTGRQVLVFLLMEKIPASDLGVELLYNIRNNTYVPYPENQLDAGSLNRLWDKLANDIKE
ncbi:unnamed protein product [Lymnaea stagnalis]|uniref:TIR domain-containing protein n=1 Tax=Lymnaea stagnalis TaxID=6523 RepID=A0AAV2I2D4_LYMST